MTFWVSLLVWTALGCTYLSAIWYVRETNRATALLLVLMLGVLIFCTVILPPVKEFATPVVDFVVKYAEAMYLTILFVAAIWLLNKVDRILSWRNKWLLWVCYFSTMVVVVLLAGGLYVSITTSIS